MAAELAAKPPEKCREAAGIVAIAAWIVPSVAAEKGFFGILFVPYKKDGKVPERFLLLRCEAAAAAG